MSFDISSNFNVLASGALNGVRKMFGCLGPFSGFKDTSAMQKKDDGEAQRQLIQKGTEKVFALIRDFESRQIKKASQPFNVIKQDTHKLSGGLAVELREIPLESLEGDETDKLSDSLVSVAKSSSYMQDTLVKDFVNIKSKVNSERAKVISKLVNQIIIKGQR